MKNDCRAELDAYYAGLYGLTRDELRYILHSKEVHGEDFPGETFRVLKEKEIRQFGEYRTRRLVMEAWHTLEGTQVVSERAPAISVSAKEEKKEGRNAPAVAGVKEATKPAEDDAAQPTMSDFRLYKCQGCGKMVLGYEKENHNREKHGGKIMDWKKVGRNQHMAANNTPAQLPLFIKPVEYYLINSPIPAADLMYLDFLERYLDTGLVGTILDIHSMLESISLHGAPQWWKGTVAEFEEQFHEEHQRRIHDLKKNSDIARKAAEAEVRARCLSPLREDATKEQVEDFLAHGIKRLRQIFAVELWLEMWIEAREGL